jgi:hypothetical protein
MEKKIMALDPKLVKVNNYQIDVLKKFKLLMDDNLENEINNTSKEVRNKKENVFFKVFNNTIKELNDVELNLLFSIFKEMSETAYGGFLKDGSLEFKSFQFKELFIDDKMDSQNINGDYTINTLGYNKIFLLNILTNELKTRLKKNGVSLGKDIEKDIVNILKKSKSEIISESLFRFSYNNYFSFNIDNEELPYLSEFFKKIGVKQDSNEEKEALYNIKLFFSTCKTVNDINIFLETNKENKQDVLFFIEKVFNETMVFDFKKLGDVLDSIEGFKSDNVSNVIYKVIYQAIKKGLFSKEDVIELFEKNKIMKHAILLSHAKNSLKKKKEKVLKKDINYIREDEKDFLVVDSILRNKEIVVQDESELNPDKDILINKYLFLEYMYSSATKEEVIAFFSSQEKHKVPTLFQDFFLNNNLKEYDVLFKEIDMYGSELACSHSLMISNILEKVSKERLDFISNILLETSLLKQTGINNSLEFFIDNLPLEYKYELGLEEVTKVSKNKVLFQILEEQKSYSDISIHKLKPQKIERGYVSFYNTLKKRNDKSSYISTYTRDMSMSNSVENKLKYDLSKKVKYNKEVELNNKVIYEDDFFTLDRVDSYLVSSISESVFRTYYDRELRDGASKLFLEKVFSKIKNNEDMLDFLSTFGRVSNGFDSKLRINNNSYLYINSLLLKIEMLEGLLSNDVGNNKIKEQINNKKEIINAMVSFLNAFSEIENVEQLSIFDRMKSKERFFLSLVKKYISLIDKENNSEEIKSLLIDLIKNKDIFAVFNLKENKTIIPNLTKGEFDSISSIHLINKSDPMFLDTLVDYFDDKLLEEYKSKDVEGIENKYKKLDEIKDQVLDLYNENKDVVFNKEDIDYILDNFNEINNSLLLILKKGTNVNEWNNFDRKETSILFDIFVKKYNYLIPEEKYIELFSKNCRYIDKEYIYNSMIDLIFKEKINDVSSLSKMIEENKSFVPDILKKLKQHRFENKIDDELRKLSNDEDDQSFKIKTKYISLVLEINKILLEKESIKKEDAQSILEANQKIINLEQKNIESSDQNRYGSDYLIENDVDTYRDHIYDKRYHFLDSLKINNNRILEKNEQDSLSYDFSEISIIRHHKYKMTQLKRYDSFEEYFNELVELSVNGDVYNDRYLNKYNLKNNYKITAENLVFNGNESAIVLGFEKASLSIGLGINKESFLRMLEIIIKKSLKKVPNEDNDSYLSNNAIEYIKNEFKIEDSNSPSVLEKTKQFKERCFSENNVVFQYEQFDRDFENKIEYFDQASYKYMKMRDNVYKNYSFGENRNELYTWKSLDEKLKKINKNGYREFSAKELDKNKFDYDVYIDLIPLSFAKDIKDIEEYKKVLLTSKTEYSNIKLLVEENVVIQHPIKFRYAINKEEMDYFSKVESDVVPVKEYFNAQLGFAKTINEKIKDKIALSKVEVMKLFNNSIRNISFLTNYMENEILIEPNNSKKKLKELFFDYLKVKRVSEGFSFVNFIIEGFSRDTNNEKRNKDNFLLLEEFVETIDDEVEKKRFVEKLVTVSSWYKNPKKEEVLNVLELGIKVAKNNNIDIKAYIKTISEGSMSFGYNEIYACIERYLDEILVDINEFDVNKNDDVLISSLKLAKKIDKYELKYKDFFLNSFKEYIIKNKANQKKIDIFTNKILMDLVETNFNFNTYNSILEELNLIFENTNELSSDFNEIILKMLEKENDKKKLSESKDSKNELKEVQEQDVVDNENNQINIDYSEYFETTDYRFLFDKDEGLKQLYNDFLMNPIAIKYKEQKEKELSKKRRLVEEEINKITENKKYDLSMYNELQNKLNNIQLEEFQIKKQISNWFKDINIKNEMFFSCVKKIEDKKISMKNFDIEKFEKLKTIFKSKMVKVSIEDIEYVLNECFLTTAIKNGEVKIKSNSAISFFLKKDIGYKVTKDINNIQYYWEKAMFKFIKLEKLDMLGDFFDHFENKNKPLNELKELFLKMENVYFSKFFKVIHNGMSEEEFVKENEILSYMLSDYFYNNIVLFNNFGFNIGKLEEYNEIEKVLMDYYYDNSNRAINERESIFGLRHNNGMDTFLVNDVESPMKVLEDVKYIVANILPYIKITNNMDLKYFMNAMSNMMNILEENKEMLVQKHLDILDKNKVKKQEDGSYLLEDVLNVCNKKYLANIINEELSNRIMPKELMYACGTTGETLSDTEIKGYELLFAKAKEEHVKYKKTNEKYPFYFYKNIQKDEDGFYTMSQVLPTMNHQTTTWGISTKCCYTLNGAASSLLKNVPNVPNKYFSFIRTKILVKDIPEELLDMIQKYNLIEEYNEEKEKLDELIFNSMANISVNSGAAISYLDSKNNIIFDNYEGSKVYIPKKDENGKDLIDEKTGKPMMIRVSSVGEDVVDGLKECVTMLKVYNENIGFAGLGLNYTKLSNKALNELKDPKKEESKMFPDEYPPVVSKGDFEKVDYSISVYSDFDRGDFKIVEPNQKEMDLDIIKKINKNIQSFSKKPQIKENIVDVEYKNKVGVQGKFEF